MTRALSGLRVVVPVTPGHTALADAVRAAGGRVDEVEFIEIAPTADPAALADAVAAWCAGEFDWMAVTSRNAVFAMDAVARRGALRLGDPVPPARVAAVGRATRQVCASAGLTVSLTPTSAAASGLVDAFPEGDGRVLVPLGDRASRVLEDGLAAKGWGVAAVEAYRTVAGRGPSPEQAAAIAAGEIDAVILTSGSVAERLAATCASVPPSTAIIAIGSSTADAAAAAGLGVTRVADEPTYEALVEATAAARGRIDR